MFAKMCRDQPRAQHVLHWLAQAEVHGERERSEELCQPESRVSFARFHGQSLSGLGGACHAGELSSKTRGRRCMKPRYVAFEINLAEQRSRVKAGGILELEIEPIINPVKSAR